jgi:hypothetical protein
MLEDFAPLSEGHPLKDRFMPLTEMDRMQMHNHLTHTSEKAYFWGYMMLLLSAIFTVIGIGAIIAGDTKGLDLFAMIIVLCNFFGIGMIIIGKEIRPVIEKISRRREEPAQRC